ncbi:putative peptide maturation dehydrogenase [Lysobacter sp.]|uniref:putative peptide maturation dehydrogenase n=1 Tax=Lysobacter sp. TaxID=72226 RepID=UPI002D68DE0B|nr:putative peptide maturation dehydrogenase [Lysobacter sp.]HZX78938.1 putative peptide maturation dehydrogenase [Lysobacter sp.]
MKIRRPDPCLIEIGDALVPDIAQLLRGELRLDPSVGVHLLCAVTGRRVVLTPDQLAIIARLTSTQWHEVDELTRLGLATKDDVLALIQRGAVISDSDEAGMATLREGEARLREIGWHPLAAVYHAHSRWSGVMSDEGTRDHNDQAHRERLIAATQAHGPVPSHFHGRTDAIATAPLPRERLEGHLWEALRSRRTTRHFDASRPLPLRDLGHLLHGTFGAQGLQELAPGVVAIRRTSPSGGALHPIEAYPLVMKVEGIKPGFYHYSSEQHALSLLTPLDEDEARRLATSLTVGQSYFSQAQALVFHVGRVDRHHWKYRRHPKAYKALLLDSGHLSQTFYLLAADQGLGAFYTAAINDADAGARLGLDPLAEVVIGANGLGIIDDTAHELHLQPAPFEPAMT